MSPRRMTYESQSIPRQHTSGFSLIELMITLVLATLLISALILSYLSGRAAAADAEALARVQENVRVVSEYLVRDIRNAGFTDEVAITFGQNNLVRRSFAAIENGGDRLRIRYLGRGHCGENFNEFVLVENEYFVEKDGDAPGVLKCRGRHASGSSVGPDTAWDHVGVLDEGRVVELIYGIDSIKFSALGPNSGSCNWDYSSTTAMESACLGVEIRLGLVGVRGEVRDVNLQATFRNVILALINNGITQPSTNE